MNWSDEEINILKRYKETDNKASDIYKQLILSGYDRTLKAVRRKIEKMNLGLWIGTC